MAQGHIDEQQAEEQPGQRVDGWQHNTACGLLYLNLVDYHAELSPFALREEGLAGEGYCQVVVAVGARGYLDGVGLGWVAGGLEGGYGCAVGDDGEVSGGRAFGPAREIEGEREGDISAYTGEPEGGEIAGPSVVEGVGGVGVALL